jgi:hypothetical protein
VSNVLYADVSLWAKMCTAERLLEVSQQLEAIIAKWEQLYRKDIRIRIVKNTTAGALCFFPIKVMLLAVSTWGR